jgi:hypothetical protein
VPVDKINVRCGASEDSIECAVIANTTCRIGSRTGERKSSRMQRSSRTSTT